MQTFEAWTDGSCTVHLEENRGGWAAVIKLPDNPFVQVICGHEIPATSQRMEMMALLRTLTNFTKPTRLVIHSDSAYLINTIKHKWIRRWEQNGWRNSKGGPVKNQDLWLRIDAALAMHDVKFVKVKGHSGVEYNELADHWADKARTKLLSTLQSKGQLASVDYQHI